MKTLALLSQKGGVGKSTLAAHIAVIAQASGHRVSIVDLDPQRSVSGWFDARAAATPELVQAAPGDLSAVLNAARDDGVDLCVLDTRPSAGADAFAAAVLSDFVVIPTRPSIFDLRAIGATVDIVAGTRVPALIVLNGVPASPGFGEASDTADARRALRDYGIPVATVAIGQRIALARALIEGHAVTEFDPGGKAAAEITALWAILEDALWPVSRRLVR